MLNAKTAEDSLYAIIAEIDNFGDAKDKTRLKSLLIKAVELNGRLNVLNLQPYELFLDGMVLWDKNERLPGIEKMKESIDAFDKENRIFGNNSLFNTIRLYYNEVGMQEKKFEFYNGKLLFYQQNGPIENTGVCYHGIGGYYGYKADYNNAINAYLQSAESYKTFSQSGYANEICVIGSLYFDWGNYNRAKFYLQNGYDLCIELKEWALAIFVKRALALVEKKLSNYVVALKHIDEALNLDANNAIYFYEKPICLTEKGGILLELHRTEGAFQILKEALQLRDSFNIPLVTSEGDLECEYYLYVYYRMKGNISDAENHLLTAYQQACESQKNGLIHKYKRELAEFYISSDKPEKAAAYACNSK
jgi:tetratricopeptide (TPR) repeat protein